MLLYMINKISVLMIQYMNGCPLNYLHKDQGYFNDVYNHVTIRSDQISATQNELTQCM